MWLGSYRLGVTFLAMVFFLGACGSKDKEGVKPDEHTDRTFEVGETNLTPDKDSLVSVLITFGNPGEIDQLIVRKSEAGYYLEEIAGKDLSESFTYQYKIQKEDPRRFKLVLKVEYTDGSESKNISLNINNLIPDESSSEEEGVREKLLVKKVTRIARVTGKTRGGENLPNPNLTDQKWNVGGTDLGIMWEMDPGRYGIFFGDTFGSDFAPNPNAPGPNGGSWRSNVLAFSEEQDLEYQGLTFESMVTDVSGKAKEVLPGARSGETSTIPTAAIRVNGIDYVHGFKVNSWDPDLSTSYSTVYKSTDNGQNWTRVEGVTFSSDSKFALVGYFEKDGYVYMVGTPTYRSKPAYLARFKTEDIEELNKYEYWNKDQGEWILGDEGQATAIFTGRVGELSLIYNQTYAKWIIAYFNGGEYNITMRVADDITGPWDQKFELASGAEYPQLYGSYFHPLSVKGDQLYFTMSMWEPYNVFLMKVELSDK